MSKNKNSIINKSIHYITNDIWRENLSAKSSRATFIIRTLRIIILAIRGFKEDRCIEKASALTYYSLLSIVPIAAMAFGFAKGFGFDENLQEYLREYLKDNQAILDQVIEFSDSMLAKTKGGVIAGIGFIILVWSVIKVLGNIESSFNQIWSVNKQRTYIRKISDYMTIMIFAPILLIISSSATSALSNYLYEQSINSDVISHFYGLISFALNIIPYSLVWFAFAFLYMILPNTKVSFKSAIQGGILAGIIFQITQYFYIKFQIGMSTYNEVYGGFAALPLFLVWMQTSWTIVLLGAEVAYATQNIKNYQLELETSDLSVNLKERLAIFILHTIILQFESGKKALTSVDLSVKLEIPHKIAKHILIYLSDAGLVNETKTDDEKLFAYTPGIAIEKITIAIAIDRLRKKGRNTFEYSDSDIFNKITPELLNSDIHHNQLIKNL